jgi:hypothetical protein
MFRDNESAHVTTLQLILTETKSAQATEVFVIRHSRYVERRIEVGIGLGIHTCPQTEALDGSTAKELTGALQKRMGPHGDILDKAAMELPALHQPPYGTYPFLSPFVENLWLASLQFGSTLVRQISDGASALDANELGAGDAVSVALFLQPVGEDKTRRIVVWMSQDVVQKSVGVRHIFLYHR